ncbi:ribonuclease R [Petrotoga sp. 9PWA.NaAc.5.4]|uniref:ribonuclease R n=1 Tax=Petrotoga sp. 9PWA.NaAc.5.4 TaxID=1434328 RepID=UPI000CB6BD3E|nr:ribonuclease R [Petrotoga sp. 9PWA.NaAc.5.4]PNR96671.1 ribonuclease R [Petrotoga sp. 9PWA.NaAc.5.4]
MSDKNFEQKILNKIKEKPMLQKEIYNEVNAKTKREKSDVRKILKRLQNDGKLIKDSQSRFREIDNNIKVGTIEFTKSGHMAFVECEDGSEIAVKVENSGISIHKDVVLVEIIGKWRNLPEGKVVKILKRGLKYIVGEFERKGIFGFVIPIDGKINTDFYVSPENIGQAKTGQIVRAKIIKYLSPTKNPEVEIVDVLGDKEDPAIDLPLVIFKHELPEPNYFSKEVLEEAKKIPEKVYPQDMVGRKDFRKETIFTIDGDTAKDFDDAVGIKKLKNGNYLLGVHIADVSHYVKENSEIDKEAFNRGTSVYLIDTVIPMLHFKLSNEICSLVEGEDRLTMSLIMEIDKYGNLVDSKIYNGVIRSKKRLTYNKVNDLLSENPSKEIEDEIGFLREDLEMMKDLMDILRNKRVERGSIIDIESNEVYFEFDEKGYVKDIFPVERGISEKMIEEFMVLANETVASYFDVKELPFIYRIHEYPDADILLQLQNYLDMLGIKVNLTQNINPKVLQDILDKTKNHPLSKNIQMMLVRSMKRAIYSEENIGHFGLASESYTHFTSPIRRYPDLVVHRLLKEFIKHKGNLTQKQIEQYSELLPKIAKHSSERERIADQAEWDLIDMKKVEYISRHKGDVFEVYITGVTKFGLFVEIPVKMISGLIHISELRDDHYNYDEKTNSLIGERTGKTYRIGDKIQAMVVRTDKIRAEVDFVPYEEDELKIFAKEFPEAKIKVKTKKKKEKTKNNKSKK